MLPPGAMPMPPTCAASASLAGGSHGRVIVAIDVEVVAVFAVRALRDWCLKQNPENVTYGEYEIGHTITQETLTDVIAWLAARPE